MIGDEPLKPEINEDTEDQQTNLENSDLTDEQKKYLDFNNKRIKELETHFSHLKIEMNENVLSEEKIDTSVKKLLKEEEDFGLKNINTYIDFGNKIELFL